MGVAALFVSDLMGKKISSDLKNVVTESLKPSQLSSHGRVSKKRSTEGLTVYGALRCLLASVP